MGRAPRHPPAKPGRADWTWLVSQEEGALVAEVSAFHRLLAHHNRHFGYRVATEIARFVKLAVAQATEPGDAAWAALDLALLQKVLVKLHGTRHELGSVLDALLRFALVGAKGNAEGSDLTRWRYVPEESVVRRKDESADTEALLPRSAAKLWRMRERSAGLHVLDAKFRLSGSLVGEPSEVEAKVDDLHKMHTYRDAIPAVRSAWVMYPGTVFRFWPPGTGRTTLCARTAPANRRDRRGSGGAWIRSDRARCPRRSHAGPRSSLTLGLRLSFREALTIAEDLGMRPVPPRPRQALPSGREK